MDHGICEFCFRVSRSSGHQVLPDHHGQRVTGTLRYQVMECEFTIGLVIRHIFYNNQRVIDLSYRPNGLAQFTFRLVSETSGRDAHGVPADATELRRWIDSPHWHW